MNSKVFLILLGVFLVLYGFFAVTNIRVVWSQPIMGFSALAAGVVALVLGLTGRNCT
jgi:hypothetical protein